MGIRTTTIYECDRCEVVEYNHEKFVGWNWYTYLRSDGTLQSGFYCPKCHPIVQAMGRFMEKVVK